jgi:hypothetical protein
MYRGIGLVRSLTNPALEESTAQLLDIFIFGPALLYAGTQMPRDKGLGRSLVMGLGVALAAVSAWKYWER